MKEFKIMWGRKTMRLAHTTSWGLGGGACAEKLRERGGRGGVKRSSPPPGSWLRRNEVLFKSLKTRPMAFRRSQARNGTRTTTATPAAARHQRAPWRPFTAVCIDKFRWWGDHLNNLLWYVRKSGYDSGERCPFRGKSQKGRSSCHGAVG